MTEHICTFPVVEVIEAEADDNLKAGWEVITPCPTCEARPYEHLEWLEGRNKELEAAILAVEPLRPWYHWSPPGRRKQIIRYGLRPSMRPTITVGVDYKPPYICLGDTPSWAWALSGMMRYAPKGEWDLWMTWQDKIVDPQVLCSAERHTGVYELRTEHRIFKRDLWHVGSRVKT